MTTEREMARNSTFQWWVKEPSGPVVNIPVEEYEGYQSEYMDLWNAIKTAGATVNKGIWRWKGYTFSNVKSCFDYLEMKGEI